MMDVNKARMVAARNNLMRYRRILATSLTDVERAYIMRRMAEENDFLNQLEQLHNQPLQPAIHERCSGQPHSASAPLLM